MTETQVARNGRSTDADLVYLIGADGTTTAKIGVSNEVERRHRTIQLMSPVPLSVWWTCSGSYPLEASLHSHFAAYRSHGEWFTFPQEVDPVEAMKTAVTLLGYADADGSGWRSMPQQQSASTLDGWLHGRLLRAFRAESFTFEHAAFVIGAPVGFVREYGALLLGQGLLWEHHKKPGVYGTRWSDDDRWALPGGL